jgi:hypothetical protein
MATFKVPCTWQMVGYYIVEAESIEEAKELTYELPLSEVHDPEYLIGSYEPDIDECIEVISK